MADSPARVVTDSMIGMEMPDIAVWSERVTVVLGQNPGPFTGPGTNTYLVGTGRRPLLLDTGQGVAAYLPLLERALAERGAEGLEQIVLTHGHPDHLGGLESVQRRFGPLPVRKQPSAQWDGGHPVIAVGEGARIRTEGATLRAIWTPGHASDHLCYYLEEEKALFTGDVVLGAGTTVIPRDGDLAAYLDSLRRILALDPERIYPAHGPLITRPREKVEDYLAHRRLREQQILRCLADGPQTVHAIVERIYTDVPAFLHAAAGESVEAHLRKLEHDNVVRQTGEEWSLA